MMSAREAVSKIWDGASIMIGGFMATGSPEILIDALVEQGTKNLTIIANDAGVSAGKGFPKTRGVGKLLSNGQIKTLIASHVGLNPEVAERMNTDDPERKLECVLIPQGTLAERIRCGSTGIGGFLTPTGVGTIIADKKQAINEKGAPGGIRTDLEEAKTVIYLNGREWLLEEPLRADFAFIRGNITDKFGNTWYRGTTRTFNPMMAGAADYVIVGAEKVVEVGEIDPNNIVTSGIMVDAIVEGEKVWEL
jgi:acetate CoA/acetoacetate CoA-transferase alpha subunit